MREIIDRLIDDFLADNDPRLEWIQPIVDRERFLPLYLGWLSALGIRPGGDFVRWDHDGDAPSELVVPLRDAFLARLAICQGAKKYAALQSLVPLPPPESTTCVKCGGSGAFALEAKLICECGGVGWVILGERTSEPAPG